VVIAAVVDPDVAALPPHITYDQAKNFAKSILKGDADAYDIIKQSVRRSWA
jgi:pyruvate dehydrogenase (quinone)